MGSIKNNREEVIVTLEVERLLDEPLRMIREGKFQVSSNTYMRTVTGWVLWSLLTHKMPKLDFEKMGQIQVSFDREAGAVVAVIEKRP